VAVLVIAHRRKANGNRADDSVMGSVAFTGIARASMHLTRDKDDKDRRLLLAGKNNLAAEGKGLAFRIVGHPPTVEWETELVDMSADDAFVAENIPETPGPEPQALEGAMAWLRNYLADGQSHSVKGIREASQRAGNRWRTVQNAANELRISRHQPGPGKSGFWKLPIRSADT